MGMSFAELAYFLIAVAVILPLHEASHALAAYFLGDPTAKIRGRLSLNPVKHIDLLGALMLVFVHFGWGKPVPVNPGNFRHPMRDSALTALAGPVSNFALAAVVALPIKYIGVAMPEVLLGQLWWIFDLSVIWGIFNMLPVPPLDGGKILGLIVPRKYERPFMKFQETGLVYFAAFILLDMLVFWKVVGLFAPSSGIGDFSIVRWIIFGGAGFEGLYNLVKSFLLFGM